MSHSPESLDSGQSTADYVQGWQATLSLLRQGKSWSGYGRNCVFLNTTGHNTDGLNTGDTRFQSAWSYTGFPSITVPIGLASNGLPLGMQLAGAPFEEAKLLRVAHWAEQALGVHLSPPV